MGNSKLAESGNTDAAFQLGLAYLQGIGTSQNLKLAERWFERGATSAADKGLVGSFYANGYCFGRDLDQAAKWLKSAGRPGDFFELAEAYRKSRPPQLKEAIALYLQLLTEPEQPEMRRAQMELGNLVLDGRYSAGDDARGRALNLEWARIIAQELLGQQEYTIAVAYDAQVDGVPSDKTMWLRFCRRAAAYNIDLAQRFYAEDLLHRPNVSGIFEAYAWLRLASEKQTGMRQSVQQLEQSMSPAERADANSLFDGLEQTRIRDGAYYAIGDPLRDVSPEALAVMPVDDPDVQLRRAFALESAGDPASCAQAMALYRRVRDRRAMDIKLVLGREYLLGTDGVQKNPKLARYWLQDAADAGSKEAASLLAN